MLFKVVNNNKQTPTVQIIKEIKNTSVAIADQR